MAVMELLQEIRSFLSGLRREHPEVFVPPKPLRPARAGEAVFLERVAHFAPLLGVEFGRVRVKDQRTLWGSCTPAGDLNFNWRLTLAPPEVLDYVVIHELAHRLEMNHSRRFWAHVARLCPQWRERRRWLRENSERLYASRSRIESASAGVRPDSHSSPG